MDDLKPIARQIFAETLQAIDIPAAMGRKLARDGPCILIQGTPLDLSRFDRVHAVSIGKAAQPLAQGLVELLAPEYRPEGIVVATDAAQQPPPGFQLIVGGHPLPDAGSVAAARAVLQLLDLADAQTCVFFLVSGGGSALMDLPLDPTIGLEDLRALHRLLVHCGASIGEINAVRKHLSAVKGGRLAAAAPLATKITLGVIDVPDGEESALASGPTLPDPTTVADACRVIRAYGLLPKLPAALRACFEHPQSIPETPKPGDPAFARSSFQILLGRDDLFHPAHLAAEAAGFVAACDNTTDNWPVKRAADFLLTQLEDLKRANPARPVALIADGELSSPVTGDGVGGRNSAFVLCCVEKIAGKHMAVLSAGTDGIDGSSPAAGAVADGETLARAHTTGLDPADYFRRCDSYSFFHKLGGTIETGPTGNNLRDLRILLAS